MKVTYRIADSLPPTPMAPRSMPAVAILPKVNDPAVPTFDQLEDGISTKPKSVHNTRVVAINDNVGF